VYKSTNISLTASITYFILKGLNTKRRDGNNVKTDIIASNIAIPVKTPKYIVGIKLDKIKIEKPKTIVIDVLSIAIPTVE
tara:strand:+ start:364 stop:603 length:240 start_codon:yes stop_codon:yes gene_type:complete